MGPRLKFNLVFADFDADFGKSGGEKVIAIIAHIQEILDMASCLW